MLTLFLELLTFFTNTVLLACILGISVGCLAANSKRNFLPYTPLMLIIEFASAHLVEWQRPGADGVLPRHGSAGNWRDVGPPKGGRYMGMWRPAAAGPSDQKLVIGTFAAHSGHEAAG